MSDQRKFSETQTIIMMSELSGNVKSLKEVLERNEESIRQIPVIAHRVGSCETRLNDHSVKLSTMRDHVNEAKGGWKVLALVAGIAGSLGGFISKILGKI